MIRSILALMVLAASAGPIAAQTALQKCRAITDSLERLRCYDAIKSEPVAAPAQPEQPAQPAQAAKPAAPAADDPLIAKAMAAVKGQLRDPDSAKFHNVKLRTVAGKQAVCGLVNAKNARGVMTGVQPFAYDGEQVYLIIYNAGPANISNQDAATLGAAMRNRVRSYNRLCK